MNTKRVLAGIYGELASVAAGNGEMGESYARIMSFIKREKPYIHVSLENTAPENRVRSRELIESVYARV